MNKVDSTPIFAKESNDAMDDYSAPDGLICEYKEINELSVMGLSQNKKFIAVGGKKEY